MGPRASRHAGRAALLALLVIGTSYAQQQTKCRWARGTSPRGGGPCPGILQRVHRALRPVPPGYLTADPCLYPHRMGPVASHQYCGLPTELANFQVLTFASPLSSAVAGDLCLPLAVMCHATTMHFKLGCAYGLHCRATLSATNL